MGRHRAPDTVLFVSATPLYRFLIGAVTPFLLIFIFLPSPECAPVAENVASAPPVLAPPKQPENVTPGKPSRLERSPNLVKQGDVSVLTLEQLNVLRERAERFLVNVLTSLDETRIFAQRQQFDLDRQITAITTLEPVRRENDLRRISAWNQDFINLLEDFRARVQTEYNQLSSMDFIRNGRLVKIPKDLAAKIGLLQKLFNDLFTELERERRRLETTLEKHRSLETAIMEQTRQISSTELLLKEGRGDNSDRNRLRRLQREQAFNRTELASLPVVNEDLLVHFIVSAEMANGTSAWLDLLKGEYELLSSLNRVVLRVEMPTVNQVKEAYTEGIRWYQRQAELQERQYQYFQRKKDQVPVTGSFHQTDRYRDLGDYYYEMQQQSHTNVRILRQRAADLEFEISAVSAPRKK